ncbi:MAG: glycosyltransferase [Elusimicrobia bacterium]|nr:glycosyltransferase [Elusimicrobiota bacterium]
MPSVIDALKNYQGESEIIVVDDNSSDKSVEEIKKFKGVNVIQMKSNGGFAHTCNKGLFVARYGVVLFLNNDVSLSKNFFHFFSDHFNDPAVFAVTVKSFRVADGRFLDGGKIGTWRYGYWRVSQNYDVTETENSYLERPYLSFTVQGAFFFADREKMLNLNGFDELMSPYIYEETDLSYRALKRGWKIVYEPSCIARHEVGPSIKKRSHYYKVRILSERNRLIFLWKNIHDRQMFYISIWYFAVILLTLNPVKWAAFLWAFAKIYKIYHSRINEKNACVKTDKEIYIYFSEYFNKIKRKTKL